MTLFQLLLRLYEPSYGTIELNGRSIRDLDVRELRRSVGLVGQEPQLFDASGSAPLIGPGQRFLGRVTCVSMGGGLGGKGQGGGMQRLGRTWHRLQRAAQSQIAMPHCHG